MRNGAVICDLVVHIHNMLSSNFNTRSGVTVREWKYDHIEMYKEGVEKLPPAEEFYAMPPSAQVVFDKVFSPGSEIDIAMAQVVPLFDLYAESPERNVERVYEMCQIDPGRMIFCGGTDPVLRGLNKAMRDIDFQVRELGARSMKFYTGHPYGRSWRMDDKHVAFPMFERMLELGVNLAQVHKGDSQGLEPLHDLRPDDVHDAALAFPEMNFIIHHLAFPFEDAAIDMAARLPNVYLAMSTWVNMIKIAPIETAMRFGKMLRWVQPEKVLWGSETPLWPAQQLLDMCWDFQIPEDLRDGWGFPEIDDEARRLMYGGNFMRLLGVSAEDVAPRSTGVLEGQAASKDHQ